MDFVLKHPADLSDGNGAGEGSSTDAVRTGKEAGEDEMDMGLIELGVRGLWRECILYEVPLMAIRESPPARSEREGIRLMRYLFLVD